MAEPSRKGELLLFLVGLNLMFLNFILVHHVTIALRNMEVAVIVFSLAYFTGISLGYLVSDRISAGAIRRFICWFPVLQMLLVVFLQAASYVVSTRVGDLARSHGWPEALGDWTVCIFVFLALAGLGTSVYSIFLPATIEAQDRDVRRYYSAEVAGSIVGLLLIPVLAGISHACLLLAYLAVFLGVAYLVGARPVVIAALAGAAGLFLVSFDGLDRAVSGWFYRHYYSPSMVEQELYARYSPYHKVEVLQLSRDRRMLVLNGRRQYASSPHESYSYFVAEYPARLLGHPTVCVLGCGSMATVGRVGDLVPSVKIVDLDPEVFRTSRRFFQESNHLDRFSNWTFVSDDAKHFVGSSREQFDLIWDDIPPARTRQIALTYTREFFERVKPRLRPHGIFSMPSLISVDARSQYGRRLIATMASVFDRYFVVELSGAAYFYGGGPSMPRYDRRMLESLAGANGDEARVLNQDQVGDLVRGATIITIDNMADLIYSD